ncbi:MAG: UbiX family flavin prenyltransferase [Phycisphaerales bacterium]|nr:UbiX family flavin prenyltransferase [Phycisphaerales bacterium]
MLLDTTKKHKIVIAIAGASGSLYAQLLLNKLLSYAHQIDTLAVVMTTNAKTIWEQELKNDHYKHYPWRYFENNDYSAPFASGSSNYQTMIIVPCSMGLLGRIAHGTSDSLMTRAADVILKERRKLILVLRDMPYNLIHIKNMELVTLAGGIVCPANPHFYNCPTSIDDLVLTVVDRILDIAGFQIKTSRWGE